MCQQLFVLIPAFFLVSSPCVVHSFDYCIPNLCPNRSHTMCKYKKCELAERCGVCSQMLEMDAETIRLILHNLNTIRNLVALGRERKVGNVRAANMIMLKYHEELGMIAQCWANRCSRGHDECRSARNFPSVGQMVASTLCSDNTITDTLKIINDWYEETPYLDKSVIRMFRGSHKYNAFTQLIWAETSFIGCGRVLYERDNTSRQMMVCNFATGGNIRDQPVYIEGEPTTQCKLDYVPDNKYTGLCTWAKGYNNKAPTNAKKIPKNFPFVAFIFVICYYESC